MLNINDNDSFEDVNRKYHEKWSPIDNCYIIGCEDKATVALKGLQSGKTWFYCRRCADELKVNPLFEELSHGSK